MCIIKHFRYVYYYMKGGVCMVWNLLRISLYYCFSKYFFRLRIFELIEKFGIYIWWVHHLQIKLSIFVIEKFVIFVKTKRGVIQWICCRVSIIWNSLWFCKFRFSIYLILGEFDFNATQTQIFTKKNCCKIFMPM